MCGISGAFYAHKTLENEKAGERVVALMNKAQARRGPDDEGIKITGGPVLGHRRLSILDLSSAGHQPMSYSGGRYWITFNGEIYNFRELKKELENKKYIFKTKTDTEVILALFQEYGEKSFAKLRGMFAFAVWDEKERVLFLARDRYGIKPLYYYSDAEKLVFASSVKAIAKSGLAPAVKNTKAQISFLLFGSVPAPETMLLNTKSLPPGHYLTLRESGEKLTRYYNPLKFFLEKKEEEKSAVIAKLRAKLEETVRVHLISDAPLGIFLSGGLDSSAIAALAAKERKKPIITISVDFAEKEFSEKIYQESVASRIGSNHAATIATKKDFLNSLDDIFEAMDEPTIDGVNSFFISKAAREAGVKVVLSGIGSDEIFCGYSSFQKAIIMRHIQTRFPDILRESFSKIAGFNDRYRNAAFFLTDKNPLNFYLGFRGLFRPKSIAEALDIEVEEVETLIKNLISRETAEVEMLNPIDLLSYLEIKFYLQNQLLKDVDFMSMYHGVETRVPFLDNELVEYVSSIPPRLKIKKRKLKPLLKETVKNILPPEIITRKKMGFAFPFENWLKSLTKDRLPSFSSEIAEKFYSGNLHWSRFWATVVLSKWL